MYTNREKKLINEAWQGLMYRCQITSNEHRMMEHLKYERKERRDTLTCKCLIMSQALKFYVKYKSVDPGQDLRELTWISEGILLGALVGFNAMERTSDDEQWVPQKINELCDMILAVEEIHYEACGRAFENYAAKLKEEAKKSGVKWTS